MFNNGSRREAIGTMALGKAFRENGHSTVSVVEHKRDNDGHANIVFEADLYYETQKYINYYRNAHEGISAKLSEKLL